MKNKKEMTPKEFMESTYPKTKEEILRAVAKDFFGGGIKGFANNGILYGGEHTYGCAIRVAVEIFCDDLYRLSPDFEGNFYVDDGFLIPFVHEPHQILIQSSDGSEQFEVKSELAGALLWCAALNKAARHWIGEKNQDRAELCREMMRDLLRELPVHRSFKDNIHKLEEWPDILKNQIPNL